METQNQNTIIKQTQQEKPWYLGENWGLKNDTRLSAGLDIDKDKNSYNESLENSEQRIANREISEKIIQKTAAKLGAEPSKETDDAHICGIGKKAKETYAHRLVLMLQCDIHTGYIYCLELVKYIKGLIAQKRKDASCWKEVYDKAMSFSGNQKALEEFKKWAIETFGYTHGAFNADGTINSYVVYTKETLRREQEDKRKLIEERKKNAESEKNKATKNGELKGKNEK